MTRWTVAGTILLICAATTAPGLAQTSAQFQACSKHAKTQLALNTCAGAELALRNKQMQSAYAQVLTRATGQPATLAKIKVMQSDWLAYAAAYLDALYPAANKQAEYGSIYPMEAALARSALVARHTLDLQALLRKP